MNNQSKVLRKLIYLLVSIFYLASISYSEMIFEKGHGSSITKVAFSKDGNLLATTDGHITALWDLKNKIQIYSWESVSEIEGGKILNSMGGIVRFEFSTNSNLISIAKDSGILEIYDLTSKKQYIRRRAFRSFVPNYLGFHPDNHHYLFQHRGIFYKYDFKNDKTTQFLELENNREKIYFHATHIFIKGNLFNLISRAGDVFLLDLEKNKIKEIHKNPVSGIRRIAAWAPTINSDGNDWRFLADGKVYTWINYKELTEVPFKTQTYFKYQFNPFDKEICQSYKDLNITNYITQKKRVIKNDHFKNYKLYYNFSPQKDKILLYGGQKFSYEPLLKSDNMKPYFLYKGRISFNFLHTHKLMTPNQKYFFISKEKGIQKITLFPQLNTEEITNQEAEKVMLNQNELYHINGTHLKIFNIDTNDSSVKKLPSEAYIFAFKDHYLYGMNGMSKNYFQFDLNTDQVKKGLLKNSSIYKIDYGLNLLTSKDIYLKENGKHVVHNIMTIYRDLQTPSTNVTFPTRIESTLFSKKEELFAYGDYKIYLAKNKNYNVFHEYHKPDTILGYENRLELTGFKEDIESRFLGYHVYGSHIEFIDRSNQKIYSLNNKNHTLKTILHIDPKGYCWTIDSRNVLRYWDIKNNQDLLNVYIWDDAVLALDKKNNYDGNKKGLTYIYPNRGKHVPNLINKTISIK